MELWGVLEGVFLVRRDWVLGVLFLDCCVRGVLGLEVEPKEGLPCNLEAAGVLEEEEGGGLRVLGVLWLGTLLNDPPLTCGVLLKPVALFLLGVLDDRDVVRLAAGVVLVLLRGLDTGVCRVLAATGLALIPTLRGAFRSLLKLPPRPASEVVVVLSNPSELCDIVTTVGPPKPPEPRKEVPDAIKTAYIYKHTNKII